MPTPSFVAIDFETANTDRASACALGLVRVVGGEIVERKEWLLKPPSRHFVFTEVHGIAWRHVAEAPRFAEIWTTLRELLESVEFVAAHNASFDKSVLSSCCAAANLRMPALEFVCTVKLARRELSIYPTTLPNVCRELELPLEHHSALSDAEACARIVLAARGGAQHRRVDAGARNRLLHPGRQASLLP